MPFLAHLVSFEAKSFGINVPITKFLLRIFSVEKAMNSPQYDLTPWSLTLMAVSLTVAH